MHRRPKLEEAINKLRNLSHISEDASSALAEYYEMKEANEFIAARYVVDIVDHFYHITEKVTNG